MRGSSFGPALATALAIVAASCCATPTESLALRPPAEAVVGGRYHPELDVDMVTTGRNIAVQQCSTCHGIDAEMTSPRREAPPLLSVLRRYDPDMLANDLIEGVRVGHDDMPRFDFDIKAADALIAYLKSIERSPAAAVR
jgi:mono/diheme cytochrome c family protein